VALRVGKPIKVRPRGEETLELDVTLEKRSTSLSFRSGVRKMLMPCAVAWLGGLAGFRTAAGEERLDGGFRLVP
jgi:hypothetical protein